MQFGSPAFISQLVGLFRQNAPRQDGRDPRGPRRRRRGRPRARGPHAEDATAPCSAPRAMAGAAARVWRPRPPAPISRPPPPLFAEAEREFPRVLEAVSARDSDQRPQDVARAVTRDQALASRRRTAARLREPAVLLRRAADDDRPAQLLLPRLERGLQRERLLVARHADGHLAVLVGQLLDELARRRRPPCR